MIASGKMFVANTLPSSVLALFDWNPLFHAIDQARGFTFINYNPLFTSVSYPLMISMILVLIGLMLEFYARRNASASHDAAR
jgi:ABC-type polysaccharide/polyol phosphate export permease